MKVYFDSIAAQVPALNVALIYLWESKIFGQITLENLTRQSRFLMQELGPLPRETTFRKITLHLPDYEWVAVASSD